MRKIHRSGRNFSQEATEPFDYAQGGEPAEPEAEKLGAVQFPVCDLRGLLLNFGADLNGYGRIFNRRQQRKQRMKRAGLFYCCGLFHKFAPGRMSRLMPLVTFISWKFISSPMGTSTSFM